MRTLTWIVLAALGPLLAGCGGAGGHVASLPPPPASTTPAATAPAPTAPATITVYSSPATRPGTYEAIALFDSGSPVPDTATTRLASPGEIRITTYQPTDVAQELSYTLEFAATELPDGQTKLTALFPPWVVGTPIGQVTEKFGDQFTISQGSITGSGSRLADYSSVSTTDLGDGRTLNSQFDYSTGLSYVSLGQWNWWISNKATGDTVEYNSVYIVHGDRTAADDVPVSGTANYTGQSLGFSTDTIDRGSAYGAGIDVSLAVDFAQRSIAALLSREYWAGGDYYGGYTSVAAVDLQGIGVIGAPGTFTIPLAGLIDATPVTGSLDGAFFGPGAQQVGGVFAVGPSAGVSLVRDAFVAAATGP